MNKKLYLNGLDGADQKLKALEKGSSYAELQEFLEEHKGCAFDRGLILELTMKKTGLYIPMLMGDKEAEYALAHNKQLAAKIKLVSFEIAIAQMYHYKRHKGRAERVAKFIKNTYDEKTSLYFVPNKFGDPVEIVYEEEGCHIDYCKQYGYLDIIGLLPFEQKEVEKIVKGWGND